MFALEPTYSLIVVQAIVFLMTVSPAMVRYTTKSSSAQMYPYAAGMIIGRANSRMPNTIRAESPTMISRTHPFIWLYELACVLL